MPKLIRADIDPSLLTWARELINMSVPVAAKKLKVKEEQIVAWESGAAKPTIGQLRRAAHAYGQSFAVFFLPAPPEQAVPEVPDCRRSPGVTLGEMTPELTLDLRTTAERRASYLELLSLAGEEPTPFPLSASLNEDPERVGERIRGQLGVTNTQQRSWRDARVAFNGWRDAVEQLGVLVFQSKTVSADEMSGYSLALFPTPTIVVNRKEDYRRRSFTLHHELCHLALRTGGLCDLVTDLERPPEDQRLEVFCNHVAGASLVPRERLLTEPLVSNSESQEWSDGQLRTLARNYGVSSEVILRRLLTLGRTSLAVYRAFRERRTSDRPPPPGKGMVPPPIDVVSVAGRPFVRRVLDELASGRISASDTSDLLGVRLKHLEAIGSIVEA